MLTVWGRSSVANVQKVLWCLGEIGAPFDHVEHRATPHTARDCAYLAAKDADVPDPRR